MAYVIRRRKLLSGSTEYLTPVGKWTTRPIAAAHYIERSSADLVLQLHRSIDGADISGAEIVRQPDLRVVA